MIDKPNIFPLVFIVISLCLTAWLWRQDNIDERDRAEAREIAHKERLILMIPFVEKTLLLNPIELLNPIQDESYGYTILSKNAPRFNTTLDYQNYYLEGNFHLIFLTRQAIKDIVKVENGYEYIFTFGGYLSNDALFKLTCDIDPQILSSQKNYLEELAIIFEVDSVKSATLISSDKELQVDEIISNIKGRCHEIHKAGIKEFNEAMEIFNAHGLNN